MRQVLLGAVLVVVLATGATARGYSARVRTPPRLPLPIGADRLRVLVTWQAGTETLLLDAGLRSPRRPTSWLLPLPSRPLEADIVEAQRDDYDTALLNLAPSRRRNLNTELRWYTKRANSLLLTLPYEWGEAREKATAADGGLPRPGPTPPDPTQCRVTVLPARTTADLTSWCVAQQMVAPPDLARVAERVFARGGWFVGLQWPAANAEVSPLGLTFATPEPVLPWPLRDDPRPLAVDLLLLTPWPATCVELPVVSAVSHRSDGRLLDERRADLFRQAGGRALIELGHLGGGDLEEQRLWGFPAGTLTFRATNQPGQPRPPRELAWRSARLPLGERLARACWLPPLVAWLVAIVLLGRWAEPPRWPWRPLLAAGALAAGWLSTMLVAGLLLALLIAILSASLGGVAAVLLAVVVLCVVAVQGRRWVHSGTLFGWSPSVALPVWLWLVAAAGVAALVVHWPDLDLERLTREVYCVVTFPACLVALFLWHACGGHARRLAPVLLVAFTAGAATGFVLDLCGSKTANSPNSALARGADQLHDALARVAEEAGVLPARLVDLTAQRAPAQGVDASGNAVPVDSSTWHGPYLRRLPVDPTTLRRDTWSYDPTSDLPVDGGAWEHRWILP